MTSAFTPHPEMLRIHDLHAFYGESHILHGIDLKVARGECVTLLGRNVSLLCAKRLFGTNGNSMK